jgi:hypothetical protein
MSSGYYDDSEMTSSEDSDDEVGEDQGPGGCAPYVLAKAVWGGRVPDENRGTRAMAKSILDETAGEEKPSFGTYAIRELKQAFEQRGYRFTKVPNRTIKPKGAYVVTGAIDAEFGGDGKSFFGLEGVTDNYHAVVVIDGRVHCQNFGVHEGREVWLEPAMCFPRNTLKRCEGERRVYLGRVDHNYELTK